MPQDPSVADVSVPVAAKDRCETFAESGVTVTHAGTNVAAGAAYLDRNDPSDMVSWSTSGSRSYASDKVVGIRLEATTSVPGVAVRIGSQTDTTNLERLELWDGNDQTAETQIATRDVSAFSSGDWVTVDVDGGLAAGVYFIGLTNSASANFASSSSAPSGGSWNVKLGGVLSTADNSISWLGSTYTFDAVALPRYDGSVTVEWTAPTDLMAWDVASYNVDADGQTVTVAVEEEQAGGWTEIISNLTRGQKIDAASPSNDVRLRADISRTNSMRNPAVNALYRRYKL